jgi:hypothetical protein
MAYKTAPEMFGDGGGFGPAVPYSVSNPPGTSAGNRGIQFGEQLTASIANRTHYALALNTDNLNTRLAAWETGGLDAAYRGGAAAVPGIGSAITLDGKAISTTSALAAMYGQDQSNAHWRADMSADVASVGIGFEVRGRGLAGLLHFEQLDSLTQDSNLVGTNLPVVLNPGGASPTTVRVTGQQPHISSASDILFDFDFLLIDISGTKKLYVLIGTDAPNTDVRVANVDGTAPTFAANQAATAAFYRPHFGSFNGLSTRVNPRGSLFASGKRTVSRSALDVIGGRSTSDTTMTDIALRIMRRTSGGAPIPTLQETSLGRSIRTSSVDGYSAQALATPALLHGLHTKAIEPDATPANEPNYRTLDWDQGRSGLTPTVGAHVQVRSHKELTGLAGTFTGAQTIQLGVSLNPFQTFILPLGGCVVEVTASSNPAAIGYYLITAHNQATDSFDVIFFTAVGGGTPSFLGATVTMTVHLVSDLHFQTQQYVVGDPIPLLATLSNSADYAPGQQATVAYRRMFRGGPIVVRDADFEIWGAGSVAGPEGIKKLLSIDADSTFPANLKFANSILAGGSIASGISNGTGFRHIDATTGATATPAVQHVFGFSLAQPDYFGGALEWVLNSRTPATLGPLKSVANGSVLTIPIRMPAGSSITSIEVFIQSGAIGRGGNPLKARAHVVNATGTTTQVGITASAPNDLLFHALSITGVSVSTDTQDLFVSVIAGTDGGPHQSDQFWGVRVNWGDPGPRNF